MGRSCLEPASSMQMVELKKNAMDTVGTDSKRDDYASEVTEDFTVLWPVPGKLRHQHAVYTL